MMEVGFASLTTQNTVANASTMHRGRSPQSRNFNQRYTRSRSPSNNRDNYHQARGNQKTVAFSRTCKFCGEYHNFKQSCPNTKTKSVTGAKDLVTSRASAGVLLGQTIKNRFFRLSGVHQKSQIGRVEKEKTFSAQ